MLTGHDPTDLMCPGDYTSAASYHQPVPGYHPGPGGGCDQLLASQSLMTSASADLNHYSGQETGPVSQPIRGQNSGHMTNNQSQVIKTEAEHTSELLDTETEESGEESEAGDTERLKTETEGGKEASTSKPPFSYVAMIGEDQDNRDIVRPQQARRNII